MFPSFTIPFKALLQPEELSEGEVFCQHGQFLWCLGLLLAKIYRRLVPSMRRRRRFRFTAGKTYLGKHALNLPQALPYLLRVLGRNVIEGEGEQRFHLEPSCDEGSVESVQCSIDAVELGWR